VDRTKQETRLTAGKRKETRKKFVGKSNVGQGAPVPSSVQNLFLIIVNWRDC
jgi:hypothetical protein